MNTEPTPVTPPSAEPSETPVMMREFGSHDRVRTPVPNLRKHFPRFTQELTDLGESDDARGMKCRGVSGRAIHRWRNGRLPIRELQMTPALHRALADDLEALIDSGELDKVYEILVARGGQW